MSLSDLPSLNAALNATSTVLLVTAWYFIKNRRIEAHQRCMISAFVVSALFLISYVVYHAQIGSKPFPGTGAIRVLYFAILIPHVILAAAVLPLLRDAPERRFSEPNRWGGGELEEAAVRPELVFEVRYDKVQGRRFRHGTKLLRLRPDKEPEQCTWREVRPPLELGDPMLARLLGSVPAGG